MRLRSLLAGMRLVCAGRATWAQASQSSATSGLDDPQYVLSFVPVLRLTLEATRHSLSRAEIDRALAGTPIDAERLIQLELLRKENDAYLLNCLRLTKQDQAAIYRASAKYGESLADRFRAHRAEFGAIFRRYPSEARFL